MFGSFLMPFGPHSGKPLRQIPTNYLQELATERLLLSKYPGLGAAIDGYLNLGPNLPTAESLSPTSGAPSFTQAANLKLPEDFSRFGGKSLGDIVSEDGGIPFLQGLRSAADTPAEIKTALNVLFNSLV